MHLTKMQLGGVPPFTKPVDFEFDERVNVFVGPNASGKSTVLLMLADYLIGEEENAKRPISQGDDRRRLTECTNDEFDAYIEEETRAGRRPNVIAASEDWIGTKDRHARADFDPITVDIAAVREVLPGVTEMIERQLSGETASEILEGSFTGISVVSVIEAFARELWTKNDELSTKARGNAMRAVELADACSKTVCGDLIRDTKSHNYIPGPDVRGYLNHPHAHPDNISILRQNAINTNDVRNFENLSIWERPSDSAYAEGPDEIPLFIGHLSSGTEGTLLWIRWLVLKMLHHYDFVDGWEKLPAILLIDEIENHLHPTWQRRVIPALLEYFPRLQIFATTHSPFVVAGLKAGQVHLLERDAEGVVTASTNTEDVVGWTADEILRTMMGVDDPTDDATAAAARELRRLWDEGPRDSEDAEAKRQERMQELRRLVDRDLLAGGPAAAQRELFEQQFAEALEKYQQSRDLGQDSG